LIREKRARGGGLGHLMHKKNFSLVKESAVSWCNEKQSP